MRAEGAPKEAPGCSSMLIPAVAGLWVNGGTVTVTTFKGKHIFGSNSDSPTYTRADRVVGREQVAARRAIGRRFGDELLAGRRNRP